MSVMEIFLYLTHYSYIYSNTFNEPIKKAWYKQNERWLLDDRDWLSYNNNCIYFSSPLLRYKQATEFYGYTSYNLYVILVWGKSLKH